jgi:metal-sulfur cluster biosynthetic enzyme
MTKEAATTSDRTPLDAQRVRDVLRQVIDPEVGRDIVSLGLVYRVDIAPGSLVVEMTMTSPACPMGDMIVGDVRAALAKALPESVEPDIRLVWEPPWSADRMSERARRFMQW